MVYPILGNPKSHPISCAPHRAPAQHILQFLQKGAQSVPLGFLIRHAGTELRRVNRICLWLDRYGSIETSKLSMFSRSPLDPRVISFSSDPYQLQKMGHWARLRFSRLEVSRNFTRAFPLPLQLVLTYAVWCASESYPMNKYRCSASYRVSYEFLQLLVRRILGAIRKVGITDQYPPQGTWPRQPLGPCRWIQAATNWSCPLSECMPWAYLFLQQSTRCIVEYSGPWYSSCDTTVPESVPCLFPYRLPFQLISYKYQ
jgi:hypothetical protein